MNHMSSQIHPTSIIDKSAVIGQNVEIGPFSLIGPDCVIGDNCVIGSSVAIHKWTELGPGVRVWHGASIGGDPQDLKYRGQKSKVVIGARTVVRECATINLSTTEGETTVIGENCLLMAYSHVAHECIVGNNVILANSVNLAGHVIVEDFAIIGGLTPVHQFCRVGQHSIVGGASAVRMDVVPFIKAAGDPLKPYGLNSVGLSRRGFTEEQRKKLDKAYRIVFRSGLNTDRALAKIREELGQTPEVAQLVEFIEKSERGITR
jgi:UDP-N-acetylglucosamine acyltransferase